MRLTSVYYWPGYMEEGVNDDAPEMAECSMGKKANIPMKCFEEGEDKEIPESDETIPLIPACYPSKLVEPQVQLRWLRR